MNFSDMLSYAGIEQLSQIAKSYDCDCSSHSKHELIQAILSHSYRQDILKKQVDEMSIEQLRLLNLILFEERKSYSTEDLVARIKQCRFEKDHLQAVDEKKSKRKKTKKPLQDFIAEPQLMIKLLKNTGWLFNGYQAHERYLYHIPEDLKQKYRALIAIKLKEKVIVTEEPSFYRNESGVVLRDIAHVLQYIKTQHIPLNVQLLMPRRQLSLLLEGCEIAEELPGKGAWKFGYGKKFGEYPDRFALLYQFCVAKKWVEESDYLSITLNGEQKITSLGEQDIVDLLKYWMSVYKTAIPNIRALVYWITQLSDEWITVSSIEQIVLSFIKGYYFDTPEQVLHKRILKMLLHLGIISVGGLDEKEQAIQMTAYGKRWIEQALNISR